MYFFRLNQLFAQNGNPCNKIGQKMSHLSMAIPVMVRVETKVMQAGPMPDKQHNQGAFGPVHLL